MDEVQIAGRERCVGLLEAHDELEAEALEIEPATRRDDLAFERSTTSRRRVPRELAQTRELALIFAHRGFEVRSTLGARSGRRGGRRRARAGLCEQGGPGAGHVERALQHTQHGLFVFAHEEAARRIVGRLHREARLLIPRECSSERGQDLVGRIRGDIFTECRRSARGEHDRQEERTKATFTHLGPRLQTRRRQLPAAGRRHTYCTPPRPALVPQYAPRRE